MRSLPDLLRPGLDVVFVGINPGEQSARAAHYYAHPGNGFWPALTSSPLVDRPLTPEDDRTLPLTHGIGFTDVVKRVVTDSTRVTAQELRDAAPAFNSRIAYASPRAVCFTSTRAFDLLFPKVRAANGWGRQPVTIQGAQAWVMPSTSGRAIRHRHHVHRVLGELAAALGRDRTAAA